jgi:hypothetical protein
MGGKNKPKSWNAEIWEIGMGKGSHPTMPSAYTEGNPSSIFDLLIRSL